MLSVGAGERRKRASSKKAGERKTETEKERDREPVRSFLNISARPLPRIKMSKRAVKEGYTRSRCLFEATCVT